MGERFRVTHTGAKVSGTLNVDDGISITDNKITASRSNDNLELGTSGTGTVKTDSTLHLHSATPIIQFQRTDNANTPGISFLGANGTEGGSIKFDGTDGTTNEIILSSFHSSAVTERLRVTTTGAKVTGSLAVTGAQVDFTALPTSDPSVAGRLWNDSGTVKISAG